MPAPITSATGKQIFARPSNPRACRDQANPPNQYRVCNWIGDLSAQFKWHIDSKRHGEQILVISLTDGRKIGFRPPGRPDKTWVLDLNAGDGYFMRGAARWNWDHRVMPSGRNRSGGESFVLAFRRAT